MKNILKTLCKEHNESLTFSECKEYLNNLNDLESSDFNFEFEGMEFRIINDSEIWDIYVEEIKNVVTDCYDLNLDQVPSFIALSIDWEQTAKNAYVDGYGHNFSSYDHSELTAGDYWIFRTN